jgi:hypothetical protein
VENIRVQRRFHPRCRHVVYHAAAGGGHRGRRSFIPTEHPTLLPSTIRFGACPRSSWASATSF